MGCLIPTVQCQLCRVQLYSEPDEVLQAMGARDDLQRSVMGVDMVDIVQVITDSSLKI